MAKYTPEEQSRISEILAPLNRNPVFSESLNPMAKTLRKIKGEPEPERVEDEEFSYSTPKDQSTDTEGGINFDPDETDLAEPPPFKPIEVDDADIDALLNDDYESISREEKPDLELPKENTEIPTVDEEPLDFSNLDSTPEEDPFSTPASDFGTNETDLDNLDFGDSTEETPPPVEDDLLAESTPEEDPFGTPDATDSSFNTDFTDTDDPFADVTTTSEDDPFADLGGGENSDPFGDTEEDAFSSTPDSNSEPTDTDFGLGDSEQDSTLDQGDEDPFTGLGEEPNISTNTEEDSVPDFSDIEDDFSDLGADPVSNVTDEPDHDPFADLSSSTGFGDDDLEPDLSIQSISEDPVEDDDNGLGSLDSLDEVDNGLGNTSYEQSLEDDLSSLAGEDDTLEEVQELTDEELAIIQREIINYPPKLKRAIIDAITNDKLPFREQKELIELIKAEQSPADIAAYLSEKLGYEVELFDKTGQFSEKGIPIIATKPIYTKQGEFERRQFIKRTIMGVAAGILLLFGLVASYKYAYLPLRAATYYKDGLEEIRKAGAARSLDERRTHLRNAEDSFQKGEDINPGDLEYLNAYGMAYMKIGEYKKSFEKLFGEVRPEFGIDEKDRPNAWNQRTEVPIITLVSGQKWDDKKISLGTRKMDEDSRDILRLQAQDKKERKIIRAGAYIYSELGKKIHDITTYINLGKFHSNAAQAFINGQDGVNYKNDQLAINYLKQVFTDGGDPHNIEATAGLAKIYYNQKNFGKASSYYNKIIEFHPKNPIGHGGLLSTYIEMWKRDRNPQFVLNHHRQVRNVLDIEEDLSLYTLSKLASFYIDLDPTELRIRYNVNPEDQVTNLDIDGDIIHILNIAFSKSEKQDGIEIEGDKYAEQYYQRGRYYISKNESLRALKQFELAASYDPAHYLAVMEMAEHYMRLDDHQEARKLLENAIKRYDTYHKLYGNKEEDETLIGGDIGRVYFDIGKIIYLNSALVSKDEKIDEFPARKVYPTRSINQLTEAESERRNDLNNARKYFAESLRLGIHDEAKKRELHFYQGWIDYMNSDYESSLASWSRMGEEDNYNNVNVMMGKANSYFYMDQLNASLGNYLKIKEDFEEKEAQIAIPVPEESTHQEIYQTLIAVYNNIGAVYERKGNTAQALKHYWRSIEIARKINSTTEIANFNKDMVFKNRGDKNPLLDDWLSPTVDTIKELRKSKRKNVFL
jgi:tetratricopeptide (TPR) repeat protein